MRLVYLASPWRAASAAQQAAHKAYLAECMLDSISRGEAPLAPHAMLPIVLQDDIFVHRQRAMLIGRAWLAKADSLAAYCDLGISAGMQEEIDAARLAGTAVQLRQIRAGRPAL